MTEYEKGYNEGYEAAKKSIRDFITRQKPRYKPEVPKHTPGLEMRLSTFRHQVFANSNLYETELLNDFFLYWSEPNKSGTKMRFENEPTWELSRRLKTWQRNEKTFKRWKRGARQETNLLDINNIWNK